MGGSGGPATRPRDSSAPEMPEAEPVVLGALVVAVLLVALAVAMEDGLLLPAFGALVVRLVRATAAAFQQKSASSAPYPSISKC